MKQNQVKYFTTENNPEEEFPKYTNYYGDDIRGRYTSVDKLPEYFANLCEELSKSKTIKTSGDIYTIGVELAGKMIRTVTGVKKLTTWSNDDTKNDTESDTDKQKPTVEKKKVTKTPKSIDLEMDEDVQEAEPSDVEKATKPVKTKPKSKPTTETSTKKASTIKKS